MVNKGRADGSRTTQLLPKIGAGLIANYFHIDNFVLIDSFPNPLFKWDYMRFIDLNNVFYKTRLYNNCWFQAETKTALKDRIL